jgi:hypothetical protein
MNKDMTYDQIFATSQDRMIEIMKRVHEKCKNDKIFEQVLLNNPTETLKKEGLELQKDISFQIVKTKEEANVLPDNVIPLLFEERKGALSEEELQKVAGGGGIFDAVSGNSTFKTLIENEKLKDEAAKQYFNNDD